VLIDSKIKSKIKRTSADNITMGYKDEMMKNKAPTNVTSILKTLTTNTVNEPNNTNDEMDDANVLVVVSKSTINKFRMS